MPKFNQIKQLTTDKRSSKYVYINTYIFGIFEENHNSVRDGFVTDLVNVMQNRPLIAKKQKTISMYINLAQPHQKISKHLLRKTTVKTFVRRTSL